MSDRRRSLTLPTALLVLAALALARPAGAEPATAAADDLAGAWRAKVQFGSGGFASVKDLEFLYAFNAGGTMTESSNYDGAPPVPPAYGVWRKIAPRSYEARYEFFVSKAPKGLEDIASGGGWTPGGRGVLLEKITLSADGESFTSTIRLDLFDAAGSATETGSTAEAHGKRIRF